MYKYYYYLAIIMCTKYSQFKMTITIILLLLIIYIYHPTLHFVVNFPMGCEQKPEMKQLYICMVIVRNAIKEQVVHALSFL